MIGPDDSLRPLALAAAVALALTACGGGDDASQRRPIGQQPSTSDAQLPEGHPEIPQEGSDGMSRAGSGLPAAVQARMDSGNAAYRAGDYEEALRHFRAAARDSAGSDAAWFGVYMAQKALGNDAAADSALRRAGELGEGPSFHPSPSDTAGGDPDVGAASTDR